MDLKDDREADHHGVPKVVILAQGRRVCVSVRRSRGDVDGSADNERAVVGVDRLRLRDGDVGDLAAAVAQARPLGARCREELHPRAVIERERPAGARLGEPWV
jgi:hypothetical protein